MAGWADWLSSVRGWDAPSSEYLTGQGGFKGDWGGLSNAYMANLMAQYGQNLSPMARDYLSQRGSEFASRALLQAMAGGGSQNPEQADMGAMLKSYLSSGYGSSAGNANRMQLAQQALNQLANWRNGNTAEYGLYSTGEGASGLMSALGDAFGVESNPYANYMRRMMNQYYAQARATAGPDSGDWISYVLARLGNTGLNYGGVGASGASSGYTRGNPNISRS
jgi:hypothetical protein